MDFFEPKVRKVRSGPDEIYPNFGVVTGKDLMIRGHAFYAIWDEERGLWSKDEFDVVRIVDNALYSYAEKYKEKFGLQYVDVKTLSSYDSGYWTKFKKFLKDSPDTYETLDEKIIFANDVPKKKDYASKTLNYGISEEDCPAYDELMKVLYSEEERAKIEWAVGSIFKGDSKNIQKFLVLYGDAGTGKSTVLNIIQKLFGCDIEKKEMGYCSIFDAKALTSSSNAFAMDAFKDNSLVAIQHDGDLSRIEDNTKLNSIVSHEQIIINEKFKSPYVSRINSFLFMGTNKPIKITDAKSGIIRRLIDVRPTGNKVSARQYKELTKRIDFELGSIANHCIKVYEEMGPDYYNSYRPVDMMYKTDVFFNFVEDSYLNFKTEDSVTLKQAYAMYKEYCNEGGSEYQLPMYKFREELKNYFKYFDDYAYIDGKQVRSVYRVFLSSKFDRELQKIEKEQVKILDYDLKLDRTDSIINELYSECKAQYATKDGVPLLPWDNVTTKLKDLDPKKVHYICPPQDHIVIDFDLKDENGNKSMIKNIEAASKWPKTYAEFSKSGSGIHLHYIYNGDIEKLSRLYAEDIEVKVFTGKSSLRRRFTKCNGEDVAVLSSGLPFKEVKNNMAVDFKVIKSSEKLRELIIKNLNKEIHDSTTPSVNFIYKLLEDAYNSGMQYDMRYLRPDIMAFCANSTHQANQCLKVFNKMKFCSEDIELAFGRDNSKPIIFLDVEVYPNLFFVSYKLAGKDSPFVDYFNPTPKDIEDIMSYRIVGYNCRRYDNHMLYARYLGASNEEIFDRSQMIINGSNSAFYGEAYNLSYTDIYDYASTKQSLKKWEIDLDIHHQELDLPWDQPVPEDKWNLVAKYCHNDVAATEVVWDHTQADFKARLMLCSLSGLTPNHTTRQHATKFIFGEEKKPQLNYTDLATGEQTNPVQGSKNTPECVSFPGYEFALGPDNKMHNLYLGTDVGFGGYVYAKPGMYTNVALLDVESLHPHSIKATDAFGIYTQKFIDIMDARLAIKHKDYDKARSIMNGAFAPYLENEEDAKDLSYALKIIINSVYGFTSATFENQFKDPRNKNNFIALRGALFMRLLQKEVSDRGFTVAHIKTDSIKIPDATPEIISFCMEFAKKYGYRFEHEATYEKICLVNDAVYIAKDASDGHWTATGAEFQHPYVFKTLFSKEPLVFKDYCETKSVKTALYLDKNEEMPDDHALMFIGKVGSFCPIQKGKGGGLLLRKQEEKFAFATGAKNYRWLEAEEVKNMNRVDDIDMDYFNKLSNEAREHIEEFGDFEWFVS